MTVFTLVTWATALTATAGGWDLALFWLVSRAAYLGLRPP